MRNGFRSQSRNPGCVYFAVLLFVVAGVLLLEVFTGLPRGIVGIGLEIYDGIVNPIDEFFDTIDQETGFRLIVLVLIAVAVVIGGLSFLMRNEVLDSKSTYDDRDRRHR